MNSEMLQRSNDRRRVGLHPGGKISLRIFRVRDSQASTGIDVADVVPVVAQDADEGGDALHGLTERSDIDDLRADVNADACGFQLTRLGTLAIEFWRLAHGNAEFVFVQSG